MRDDQSNGDAVDSFEVYAAPSTTGPDHGTRTPTPYHEDYQASDYRSDWPLPTTSVPTVPRIANSSHPLLSMLDELLDMIVSRSADNDRLCLQTTSRRFYYLSYTTARVLSDQQRDAFVTTMKRQAYNRAVTQEAAGGISRTMRPCSGCADIHPVCMFSMAQLSTPALWRGCRSSERRIIICNNKSISIM